MDPLILILTGMLVVLGGILLLRLPAFLALILGGLIVGICTPETGLVAYAASKKMAPEAVEALLNRSIGSKLAIAFGETCAKIGILIAMASVVGSAMLKSGAAERIIQSMLKWMGIQRVPLAFLSSGFLLAIPVYFDTVFYLMIPLARSMGMRKPIRYSLYVMATVAGASMAHSLIPPTPGPLFVANELGVGIGVMIFGGLIIGCISVASGYLYAVWANKRWQIPMRETEGIGLTELKNLSATPSTHLPAFAFSILPILLPVVLIAGKTLLFAEGKAGSHSPTLSTVYELADTLGNSNIAMILAAALALVLLYRYGGQADSFQKTIGSALNSAGRIILIIGAGGAFGAMLQQTGIGPRIVDAASGYQLAILPLAFGITTLIRTAQGSATVAMITTMGMFAGIADLSQLGYHPIYLALAVGCGSKPFSWMNDSGFWIISTMSGFTEAETLRHISVLTTTMGICGLIATLIGAYLFPFV